ncbi:glycoside hydrolase [Pedobacter sp. MC2016-14]|uniref:sialidase family protein n=1 Tax=Pedobacter sp. MC2016-14 TaxID=2897327 RepID=UPI001E61C3DC|nr:sialidase family protein [Pedobacter sp. MC2016-14]MCD0489147.1 glycoside hydrolase [Pedobacter sp. MC2016-14]
MMKQSFQIFKKLAFTIFLLPHAALPLMAQHNLAQILGDTRSFEVSACKPSKNEIVTVWMEKRTGRKDNNENAADMQVGYKYSANNGEKWTEKGLVDLPNTFGTGNPFVANNEKGNTYLVCMHIGKDFYSGNISLYEFDFAKKQFYLKSVPIKSDDQLLDKPSFVSYEDEIHLVYVAYPKRAKNAVKYQMSKDKGKTWTEPIDVFSENGGGFLGPSIAISKDKQVIVSIGAYGNKNIMVARKAKSDNIAFEKPIVVSQVSVQQGAAMTELSTYKKGMIITWQNPHQRNETYLSYSKDEGNSWAKPFMVTSFGNLTSAAFDEKGNIHCMYSDFSNQKFFVGYKLLDSKFKVLQEENLTSPTPLATFTEYLGAYQKLLIQGNELFAFWIDYHNSSTLKFTKWKM